MRDPVVETIICSPYAIILAKRHAILKTSQEQREKIDWHSYIKEISIVSSNVSDWESFTTEVQSIKQNEGALLLNEVYTIYENSSVIYHPDVYVRRAWYDILMDFICTGLIVEGEMRLVFNPLLQLKTVPMVDFSIIADLWMHHWCRAYLKDCILYGKDPENLLNFINLPTQDTKELKELSIKISETEVEPELEEMFKGTCKDILIRRRSKSSIKR
ncbi:MAG: hypothetical protein QW128_06975 [Thermoprotei archaeon]